MTTGSASPQVLAAMAQANLVFVCLELDLAAVARRVGAARDDARLVGGLGFVLDEVHPVGDVVALVATLGVDETVRAVSAPDPVAEQELVAVVVPARDGRARREQLAAQSLCEPQHVEDALQLLDREHPQREAQDGAHAAVLAAQAVVEQQRDDEAEVRLGLAAAGREPQHVDAVQLGEELWVIDLAGTQRRRAG